MDFEGYDPGPDEFYDEMFAPSGAPRPACDTLARAINGLRPGELERRQATAEQALMSLGVTFTLGGEEGAERIFPFDVIPRVIDASEWKTLERGLTQRYGSPVR